MFPTGRNSATFRDKGTEVPSLSQADKGTTGQAQNLAMGRDGQGQSIKIRAGTRTGTITIFLAKSGTGRGTGRYKILTAFPAGLNRTEQKRTF